MMWQKVAAACMGWRCSIWQLGNLFSIRAQSQFGALECQRFSSILPWSPHCDLANMLILLGLRKLAGCEVGE